MGAIADDGEIDLDVLVDGRTIDVDVDLFRARRKGVETSGDAVVEARADRDHQIAVMHGVIGFPGAVHAEHAKPVFARPRIGAEPHQRRGDGKARQADEFAQQRRRRGSGIDDAAAGIKDRTLRRRHHAHGLLHRLHVGVELGMIGLVRGAARRGVDAARKLHVLGDVDDHGSGPAGRGHIEGFMQHARQIGDVLDQIIVLRAVAGDADRVAFLKGVGADEMRRHLPGDADKRDRIHQRVGEARHRIGGARSRGDEQHADLARGARIALRGMGGPLLMAHENVLHLLLLEEHVVDRKDGAARIAEKNLHALVLQGFDHHFGAGHFLRHHHFPSCFSRRATRMFFVFGQQKRPSWGLGSSAIGGGRA